MTLLTSLLIAQNNDAAAAALGGFLLVVWLISLAISLLVIVGMWKMFSKAGKPGWASIIPIYNCVVLLEIVGKPIWWVLLLMIPFVNFVIAIILNLALAERFGKGGGFAVGLIFLPFIFIPMLGFGSATYQPAPAPTAAG
jgi:hypothetical protein